MLKDEIREKLEWFMDTSLAISGSTDDVDVIEKDQTRLLDDTTTVILAEVKKELPDIENWNCDNVNCGRGAICNFCAIKKTIADLLARMEG